MKIMEFGAGLKPYVHLIYLGVVGLFLFAVSLFVPNEAVQEVLKGFAFVIIGAVLIDGMLTIRFQLDIKSQVEALEGSIQTLQNTVAIASGAVESGLTAVYSERHDCLDTIRKKLENLINESKHAGGKAPRIEIKMLGISLGDFLCPHGLLQPTFRELLKLETCSLEIVILKDGSTSAHRRALREETGKFSDAARTAFEKNPLSPVEDFKRCYSSTKCHDELKTATDYLHDVLERRVIDRERPNRDEDVQAELHVFEYDCDPMTFLFMADEDMFVENYHLAGRGGEAPILRVARLKRQTKSENSRLYEIYMGHFEAMKSLSGEVTINGAEDRPNPRHIQEGAETKDEGEE